MKVKQHIEPRNSKGKYHGLCIYYYDNGNVWYKERCLNGKRHGIGVWHDNGKLLYKNYYLNGKLVYSEWYGSLNRIEFRI